MHEEFYQACLCRYKHRHIFLPSSRMPQRDRLMHPAALRNKTCDIKWYGYGDEEGWKRTRRIPCFIFLSGFIYTIISRPRLSGNPFRHQGTNDWVVCFLNVHRVNIDNFSWQKQSNWSGEMEKTLFQAGMTAVKQLTVFTTWTTSVYPVHSHTKLSRYCVALLKMFGYGQ